MGGQRHKKIGEREREEDDISPNVLKSLNPNAPFIVKRFYFKSERITTKQRNHRIEQKEFKYKAEFLLILKEIL